MSLLRSPNYLSTLLFGVSSFALVYCGYRLSRESRSLNREKINVLLDKKTILVVVDRRFLKCIFWISHNCKNNKNKKKSLINEKKIKNKNSEEGYDDDDDDESRVYIPEEIYAYNEHAILIELPKKLFYSQEQEQEEQLLQQEQQAKEGEQEEEEEEDPEEFLSGFPVEFSLEEPILGESLTKFGGLQQGRWVVHLRFFLRALRSSFSSSESSSEYHSSSLMLLTPEQELDRYLALNSKIKKTKALSSTSPSSSTSSTAEKEQESEIEPPQTRMSHSLNLLVSEAVDSFQARLQQKLSSFPATATGGGTTSSSSFSSTSANSPSSGSRSFSQNQNKTMNSNTSSSSTSFSPSTSTSSLSSPSSLQQQQQQKQHSLLCRQAAGEFSDHVRHFLYDQTAKRLFQECGVRICDLTVTRA